MSNPMLAYVGLSSPYRFERAIIAVVALVLVLAVLLAAGWLVAIGELTAFGPRAFYFLYLLVLLVLAIALLRWPRLAGALLILALVDFGWGVGSYALRQFALGAASLLPADKFGATALPVARRCCRPFPSPRCSFTSATGLAISHTSEGTRGQDPAPGESRSAQRRGDLRRLDDLRYRRGRRRHLERPPRCRARAGLKARVASSSSIMACRATRRSNT